MKTPLIEQLIAMLPKEDTVWSDKESKAFAIGYNDARGDVIDILPQLVEVVEKATVERIRLEIASLGYQPTGSHSAAYQLALFHVFTLPSLQTTKKEE